MICSNCGTANEPGTRFCDECGTALSAACPNCGSNNRPSAKFCATCGAALDGTPPPPAQRSESAIAERRLVTVLFVDLVGFTPFAEERDPEQVRDTLDRYFAIARLAIERHGGTIEKFIGDAVMAVWGTPIAHEDDAERAVRAALELVDGVPSLGAGISARAGVMSGDAAVTIGAEGQGMVAGDLINTASRLQSVASPGTVLVSDATMRAAEAAVVFEPVGPQELKGKSAPVDAFRAIRVVANRGGSSRSEAVEAPFVGRDEELRQLKELLHTSTRDPRVRLVSITGPAGIGKSRLTWEFEKYVDGLVETIFWHRGRSPAYGEGVTFWALGEMVRRRAELTEADDEATTRARIERTVAEVVDDADERAWIVPALLTLLGIEAAPPGGRDALFAAWRIFFERIAGRGTTALVFEDLQWADDGLLDFIEHVLEWSKNLPLLVITLSRPDLFDRRPGWASGQRFMTAMGLEPLADEHMRALLVGLAPALPEQTVAQILRRADGIPLYAVEIVRMLAADGKLELIDGAYRANGDLGEVAVPETLRSLIASRLDALDPADRSLLQDASVLGQRFSLTALASVAGQDADKLEPRLRNLGRREFLDVELDPRSPERGQYGFVQSLIREVAYGMLAKRDRRSRHLAAARYFEAMGDEELAGALANHYVAAFEASNDGPERDAVAVQARLALRGAAERAASLGSHDQAITYAEQAASLSSADSERAELLELASESAGVRSDPRSIAFGRQALDYRRSAGDPEEVLASIAKLARVMVDAGVVQEALALLEAAVAPDGAETNTPATAALLAALSRVYMRSSRPRESIATADRALTIAERLNLDIVVADAFVAKGSAIGNVGRRRESRALLREALVILDGRGALELELRARNNLSVALYEDDPKEALGVLLRSIEIAERTGQGNIANWQLGAAAMYMLVIGEDWDEPLHRLDEVIARTPTGYDGIRALAIKALYEAYQGTAGDAVVAAHADAQSAAEVQVAGTLLWAEAVAALNEGRYRDAHEAGMRAPEQWLEWTSLTVPISLRAAQMLGDRELLDLAATRIENNADSGPNALGAQTAAAAARSAADGEPGKAAAEYRRAADIFAAAGFHLLQAEALVDAIVFTGVPEARGWEAEALQILERIGARAVLARLDSSPDASSRKDARLQPSSTGAVAQRG